MESLGVVTGMKNYQVCSIKIFIYISQLYLQMVWELYAKPILFYNKLCAHVVNISVRVWGQQYYKTNSNNCWLSLQAILGCPTHNFITRLKMLNFQILAHGRNFLNLITWATSNDGCYSNYNTECSVYSTIIQSTVYIYI